MRVGDPGQAVAFVMDPATGQVSAPQGKSIRSEQPASLVGRKPGANLCLLLVYSIYIEIHTQVFMCVYTGTVC